MDQIPRSLFGTPATRTSPGSAASQDDRRAETPRTSRPGGLGSLTSLEQALPPLHAAAPETDDSWMDRARRSISPQKFPGLQSAVSSPSFAPQQIAGGEAHSTTSLNDMPPDVLQEIARRIVGVPQSRDMYGYLTFIGLHVLSGISKTLRDTIKNDTELRYHERRRAFLPVE